MGWVDYLCIKKSCNTKLKYVFNGTVTVEADDYETAKQKAVQNVVFIRGNVQCLDDKVVDWDISINPQPIVFDKTSVADKK